MIIFYISLDPQSKDLINKLYQQLHIPMRKMAIIKLKDPNLAEEAVANSFVKIMDKIEKISGLPQDQRQVYSLGILKNECINLLRKEKKYLLTEDLEIYQDLDLTSPVEDQVLSKDSIDRLKEKIKNLSLEDRLLLSYKYEEGLTYKELGEKLGLGEEAAKKRGQRIIKSLRDSYQEGENSER
ncbi:MAG: sigma-70 family RNA polymerase sigma factor [Bacillota bacterium]|nr:sigma-70 family RNA polymerase sigma factor [Bacillota bacterium]